MNIRCVNDDEVCQLRPTSANSGKLRESLCLTTSLTSLVKWVPPVPVKHNHPRVPLCHIKQLSVNLMHICTLWILNPFRYVNSCNNLSLTCLVNVVPPVHVIRSLYHADKCQAPSQYILNHG